MSDVFISYSRLDRDFVGRLRDALHTHAQEVWIDWESIPPSQAWWNEIKKGIARANNFVVVLSPSSMASPICHLEIEYARQLNKRIIPVLHLDYEREPSISAMALRLAGPEQDATRAIWGSRQPHAVFDGNDAELKHINYFFFRADADFDTRFSALFEVIRTDYAHKEQHTTLELRALEWDRRERNPSFLLLDDELADAEAWLAAAEGKAPPPGDLHRAYIAASRHAEDERHRLEAKRLRDLRQARFGIVLGIGAALLLAALALSFNAAREEALVEQRLARQLEATANAALTNVPPTLNAVATEVQGAQNFVDSVQLAIRGQDVYDTSQNNPLGLRLAYEASLIDDSPQVQRILGELAYPPSARARMEGHTGQVRSVAVSPNGTTALSGSFDNTLILWDLASGEVLRRLEGHTGAVRGVAISPDGATAVSGSEDNTLILWDLSTGEMLRHLRGHTDEVWSVAISPDGATAVSGSFDNSLIVWDLASGEALRRMEGHAGAVRGVAISPDGATAVSGSFDNSLIVWDLTTGEVLRRIEGHTQPVNSIAISPDGLTALSAASDSTLILWDIATGEMLRRFEGHTSDVWSVAISPDGSMAVSGSWDSTVIVWDLSGTEPSTSPTSDVLARMEGHVNSVWSVTFSPDGSAALSGSWDNTVIAWDLTGIEPGVSSTGEVLQRMQAHTDDVLTVAISPDGKTAVTGSSDDTVILWDLSTGEVLRRMEEHTDIVSGVAISPDGAFVLSSSWDHTLIVWDLSANETQAATASERIRRLEGHTSDVSSVTVSPDGTMALSGDSDGIVILWDLTSGEMLRRMEGHTANVWSVAFSPNGSTALSGAWDNTVILWDLATGEILRRMEGHTDWVSSVAYNPDGATALSGSFDNTLIVWDLATGEVLRRLEGHTAGISDVGYSPDGTKAVSGAIDNTVIVWDLLTGEVLRRLEGHTAGISGVAYSPDGATVLSGSSDGTAILWRLHDFEQIRAWTLENRYMPELTCEQRRTYALPEDRQCVSGAAPPSQTPLPTRTPLPLPEWTPIPSPTPTFTPSPTPTPTATDVPFSMDLARVDDLDVPASGELIHDVENRAIEIFNAEVLVADFVLEVTFINPYHANEGYWDYGVIFRGNPNAHYRLILSSAGDWSLTLRTDDSVILQSDFISTMNIGDGEANQVRFEVQGSRGVLRINDQFVANLDLSANTSAGDLLLATGFFDDSEITGEVTRFEGFRVQAVGPVPTQTPMPE